MNITSQLFDRYKDAVGVRSDRQAAMKLGVKVQTVSNWRMRGSQAEAATIDAMCRQLGEDPAPWLLRIQAQQGGEGSRNGLVWKRVARQLGVSLSLGLIAAQGLVDLASGNGRMMADQATKALALIAPAQDWLPLLGC